MREQELEADVMDLTDRVEFLTKSLNDMRREKTDLQYFLSAYYNMLGPKGREVVEMWNKMKMKRVHFSWGPEAHKMTGEQRAQFILDLENAPMRKVEFIDDEPVEIKDGA